MICGCSPKEILLSETWPYYVQVEDKHYKYEFKRGILYLNETEIGTYLREVNSVKIIFKETFNGVKEVSGEIKDKNTIILSYHKSEHKLNKVRG